MQTLTETAPQKSRVSAADFDVIVVGAGFAGLYMLHRLRGMGFSVLVLEAGSGVGGTWYWNRYPGARCDVESVEYSYQFSPELQQEWEWSERYAAQPELLRYANHVADRFDLRGDIQFDTRVTAATFDEAANTWIIETNGGARLSANYCVMATGCLSVPNEPKFKGTETFAGPTYHTGKWPHEGVDFTNKRVGIIGTGSSAVQSIPIIASQAKHLYVFQRTPSFVVPARNAPLSRREQQAIKDEYPALRALAKTRRNGLFCATTDVSALAVTDEERERAFRERYDRGGLCYTGTFSDLLIHSQANEAAADFLRARIREVVKDPDIAEALCPRTVVGGKRLCIDIGYYETFNRDNVTLIDLNKTPLDEITRSGLIAGGKAYLLDAIVYAIGFDAMTGALTRIDICGKAGAKLADRWAEGPCTYLGLCVAEIPNLFIITGPGSPSVLTNMLPTIEQHVEWIADCIGYMRERNFRRIEATPDAETAWVARVNEIAAGTLFPTCNSWYLGANVPGKPRVFMPYIGFPPYVEKCNEVAASGYSGFALS
jgi:cation diffusion facilitator CzcD-associated flavoprotein CzcO